MNDVLPTQVAKRTFKCYLSCRIKCIVCPRRTQRGNRQIGYMSAVLTHVGEPDEGHILNEFRTSSQFHTCNHVSPPMAEPFSVAMDFIA